MSHQTKILILILIHSSAVYLCRTLYSQHLESRGKFSEFKAILDSIASSRTSRLHSEFLLKKVVEEEEKYFFSVYSFSFYSNEEIPLSYIYLP